MCLAAAVANLTLLGTTSDALTIGRLHAPELTILASAASLSLTLLASLVAAAVGASTLNAYRIRPTVPDYQPLQAGSRPAF